MHIKIIEYLQDFYVTVMSLQKFPAPVLCETCFSLQPVRIYLLAASQSLLALSLSILVCCHPLELPRRYWQTQPDPSLLFQPSEVVLPSCVSAAPPNPAQKQQRHIQKNLMVARYAAQIS